jgi:hypothetical protein
MPIILTGPIACAHELLAGPSQCSLAIKAKGRILFINPGDVVAVQAEGNYVSLQRELDSYLLRKSISRMAAEAIRIPSASIN